MNRISNCSVCIIHRTNINVIHSLFYVYFTAIYLSYKFLICIKYCILYIKYIYNIHKTTVQTDISSLIIQNAEKILFKVQTITFKSILYDIVFIIDNC
jgi:hypothetical protein